jgi:ATP-dependent helicase/nuclease subunit A
VRDLLAAVTFAVQPLDDLNLANLLVSPLIGWSQEQLFQIAFGREKKPLWEVLRAREVEQPHHRAAAELLRSLLAMADYAPPSRFLETILSGPIEGRRKLYARLGLAARDPIDELLASALEFERGEVPSLDRFLAWFARGEVEIQRDPSAPANAVRVMTVHGAKGLEAPYVILADATADPKNLGGRNPPLDLPIAGGEVPVIRPRKAERLEPFATIIAEEEARDLEEHWRLLYVGLTRASERLVVAGREPSRELAEDCWHKRVERALMALGAVPEPDDRWGQATRYRGSVEARATAPKPPRQPLPSPTVPDWALRAAPPEARPPRPLAPSALAEDREPSPPPSAEQRWAARRGTLIHSLFERLPGVEEPRRMAAALRWLEHSAGVAEADERQRIAELVCSIVGDPRFSDLFGPDSLAEAPIAAALPDGRVIAGTVDRLLVRAEEVAVIDYKTGRVPESEADIPPAHRAQMSAYCDALAVIFPGRRVRASLLYTGEARLIELVG